MNIQQFNYFIDMTFAILWQYDGTYALKTLINSKQVWYSNNQSVFWNFWQNHVFSVLSIAPQSLTQEDAFGLSVWSYILNVPLEPLIPPEPLNKPTFGFNWQNAAWTGNLNFYYANFSNGGSQIGIPLDQQQLILRLRYFNLITRGDVLSINKFLNYVFPGVAGFSGSVYVLDNGKMEMIYVFTGALSDTLKDLLLEYDALPRPAGVDVKIWSNITKIFGFGSFNQNFEHGSFIGE